VKYFIDSPLRRWVSCESRESSTLN
jgi:hypothetical protein